MAHRKPRAVLLAALCAVLALPAGATAKREAVCKPESAAAASAVPREAAAEDLERAALCLINHERVTHGLARLKPHPRLSRAAVWHSHDMVRRDYFSHTSRNGKDVVDRLHKSHYLGGRFSWMVGENIAWGSGDRGTPRSIVQAWMDSPGHRQNMLSASFREIGIGVVKGAPGSASLPAATYTTTFGVRR
jgi:uncharacterized protein YkwD